MVVILEGSDLSRIKIGKDLREGWLTTFTPFCTSVTYWYFRDLVFGLGSDFDTRISDLVPDFGIRICLGFGNWCFEFGRGNRGEGQVVGATVQ